MIQDQAEHLNIRPASDRLTEYGISQARDFADQIKHIIRQRISGRLYNNSIDWNAEDENAHMSDEAKKIDLLAASIMEELAFENALSRPVSIRYRIWHPESATSEDFFEGFVM